MSKHSEITGLSADVKDGYVSISDGILDIIIGKGESVKLVANDEHIYLYWLSYGQLRRGTVSINLSITGVEVVYSAVSAFSAKYLQGVAIAYAVVVGTEMYVNVNNNIYASEWPSGRLNDFDFDFNNDMSVMAITYMRPGSPVQAFTEYYQSEDVVPTGPDIPDNPSQIFYHFYRKKFISY